ncbi:hypothetical protein [Demequina rhizosphaerae]|uniref:hypothetical protein n=1 Tax=Demequina rhizosphaerae TaxID=1638985 RepID=UPI0007847643|nr:hypothetical protein [Demequina rhizosphaerae]
MRFEVPLHEAHGLVSGRSPVKAIRTNATGQLEVEFDHTIKPIGALPVHKTLPVIAVVRRYDIHGDTLTATLVAKLAYTGQPHVPTRLFRDGLACAIAEKLDDLGLPAGAVSSRAVSPAEVEVSLDLRAVSRLLSERLSADVHVCGIVFEDPLTIVAHLGEPAAAGTHDG